MATKLKTSNTDPKSHKHKHLKQKHKQSHHKYLYSCFTNIRVFKNVLCKTKPQRLLCTLEFSFTKRRVE